MIGLYEKSEINISEDRFWNKNYYSRLKSY